MILVCSQGHEFDTSVAPFRSFKEGERCPMETSFDHTGLSAYCRRMLREQEVTGDLWCQVCGRRNVSKVSTYAITIESGAERVIVWACDDCVSASIVNND